MTWSGQSLGLESALDWAENIGRDRESWIEDGPGLERGTWTRQIVLLWRDSLELSRESWIGKGFELEREVWTRHRVLLWRKRQ